MQLSTKNNRRGRNRLYHSIHLIYLYFHLDNQNKNVEFEKYKSNWWSYKPYIFILFFNFNIESFKKKIESTWYSFL